MQRHKYRAELWFVAEGTAGNNWEFGSACIKPYKTEVINPMEWHQLHNSTKQPLKVIEIQYGEQCEEEDIERK
jgi:mannose-6-phosphate isomerase-like protein (cupin superfamily)